MDDAIVGDGIGTVDRRRFDEMNQDARSFDMPQEFMPEAEAGVGAFDEPGRSASTNERSKVSVTNPRLGYFVVKGNPRFLGRAAGESDKSVLLPALGLPMRPTSAMTLSSRIRRRCSPLPPGVHSRARLVEDLKAALPLPPLPAGGDDLLAGFDEVFDYEAGSGVDNDGAWRDEEN